MSSHREFIPPVGDHGIPLELQDEAGGDGGGSGYPSGQPSAATSRHLSATGRHPLTSNRKDAKHALPKKQTKTKTQKNLTSNTTVTEHLLRDS